MSLYNIRVELHHAQSEHYRTLASKFAATGVYDIIKADNGRTYRLPSGEYACESNYDLQYIRQECAKIAGSLGLSFGIRVSQGPMSFEGLDDLSVSRDIKT